LTINRPKGQGEKMDLKLTHGVEHGTDKGKDGTYQAYIKDDDTGEFIWAGFIIDSEEKAQGEHDDAMKLVRYIAEKLNATVIDD